MIQLNFEESMHFGLTIQVDHVKPFPNVLVEFYGALFNDFRG